LSFITLQIHLGMASLWSPEISIVCCNHSPASTSHYVQSFTCQDWQSLHTTITLLLLVRATYRWVLLFAHIPFMVNCAFSTTPAEWLQQCFIGVTRVDVKEPCSLKFLTYLVSCGDPNQILLLAYIFGLSQNVGLVLVLLCTF